MNAVQQSIFRRNLAYSNMFHLLQNLDKETVSAKQQNPALHKEQRGLIFLEHDIPLKKGYPDSKSLEP